MRERKLFEAAAQAHHLKNVTMRKRKINSVTLLVRISILITQEMKFDQEDHYLQFKLFEKPILICQLS
jgi:uncharacterized protein (UPF0303 family)